MMMHLTNVCRYRKTKSFIAMQHGTKGEGQPYVYYT